VAKGDAAYADAALQRFVFLGCRDKPGKDEERCVKFYEAWYNKAL
jgi:hypothetical protein